jgi:hypothetical protein
MKQGVSPATTLAERVIHSCDIRESHYRTNASGSSGNGLRVDRSELMKPAGVPIGMPMSQQFATHMRQPVKTILRNGRDFAAPLLCMAGHVPVQAILLRARLQFTEMVEDAIAKDALLDAEVTIKRARSEVIASLTDELPKSHRTALNSVQTVLQEQQHTIASLIAARDAGDDLDFFWQGEMRFYERHDGNAECHCLGKTVLVQHECLDTSSDTVLVTTDITKDVRRAFFEAHFGGSGALVVDGVAGTGKTETCKDICEMLGMSATVASPSDLLLADELQWTQHWQEATGDADVLIIEEANCWPISGIEAAIRYARGRKLPLCLTLNSANKDAAFDLNLALEGRCTRVQTSVPMLGLVMSSMLGAEGFQHCDDLGDQLVDAFGSMKTNASKQFYYDFGLRKLKSVTMEAGKLKRAGRFADEQKAVTTAVQMCCASAMAPKDETVMLRSIVDSFGADALVPLHSPSDFWNSAATKISRTASLRHASLCLPVLESEEAFMLAVTEEEAKKAGATLYCMDGTMHEMSQAALFGDFVNGQWVDGSFTRTYRAMASQEKPGWMVAFTGTQKFCQENWKILNSVMDDNKCLSLPNGEKIALKASDRIVFAAPAPAMMDASPATISRMGIINLDASHRQRL